MAKRVYFTKEEDERLIDLIKLRPPLYNIQLKSYKDLMVKENIWKVIAKDMKKTVTECKVRWKSLRDYFMHKRRELKKPTGSVATFVKLDPRYESLMFLNSVGLERSVSKQLEMLREIETKKEIMTSSSMEIQGDLFDVANNKETGLEETESTSLAEIEELDEDVQTFDQLPIFEQNLHKSAKKTKINSNQMFYKTIEKSREERLNLLRKIAEKPELAIKDAIDLFFESLAATVKTFPPELIAKGKLQIMNVVTKLELEAINKTNNNSTPTQSCFSDFQDSSTYEDSPAIYCISIPSESQTTNNNNLPL